MDLLMVEIAIPLEIGILRYRIDLRKRLGVGFEVCRMGRGDGG